MKGEERKKKKRKRKKEKDYIGLVKFLEFEYISSVLIKIKINKKNVLFLKLRYRVQFVLHYATWYIFFFY